MINTEYIKLILADERNEDLLINTNDYITQETIELLRTGTLANIKKCFKSSNTCSYPTPKYKVQLKCDKCGQLYDSHLSKTGVYGLFSKKTKQVCDLCKEKEKTVEKVSARDNLENKTADFIELYLNPNNSWKKNTKMWDIINPICNSYGVSDKKIAEYIREMDYKDFLNTPYWYSVALNEKRKSKFKCALCGKGDKLNVHHRTYDSHGYEHLSSYAKDMLIVLCSECHNKFHDKVGEIKWLKEECLAK